MTDDQRKALCAYCRIEYPPSEEDTLVLDLLFQKANTYMKNAGIVIESNSEYQGQYKFLLYAMILESFDRRSSSSEVNLVVNVAWRREMTQLKQTLEIERSAEQWMQEN